MFHRKHNDVAHEEDYRRNQHNNAPHHRIHTWTSSSTTHDANMRNRNEDPNNKWNIKHGEFFPTGQYNSGYGNDQWYGNDVNRSRNVPVPPPLPPVYHSGYDQRRVASNTYDRPFTDVGTKSDWDHYAVRHEDALIGDPIPYADDALHAGPYYGNRNRETRFVGNRPVDNYANYGHEQDRRGHTRDRLEGPVAFDAPLDVNRKPMRGNYSSGTVIENSWGGRDPVTGFNTRRPVDYVDTTYRDDRDLERRSRGSRWGWGGEPLFRDVRDTDTPLLPENPWTHNELGREYIDGRNAHLYKQARNGTVYAHDVPNSRTTHPTFVNNYPQTTTTSTTTRHAPQVLDYNERNASGIPVPPPLPPVYHAPLYHPQQHPNNTHHNKYINYN